LREKNCERYQQREKADEDDGRLTFGPSPFLDLFLREIGKGKLDKIIKRVINIDTFFN